jgi:hypothetical protein
MNISNSLTITHWSTNLNISYIAYEWSLLSAILIIDKKNEIFFLSTYPYVKLWSRKGETNNIFI